jgi:hypothetical protein
MCSLVIFAIYCLFQLFVGLMTRFQVLNFAIAYGMTPFGLQKVLGVTRQEAKAVVDRSLPLVFFGGFNFYF